MSYEVNRAIDKVAGETIRQSRRAGESLQKEAGWFIVPGLGGYAYGKNKGMEGADAAKTISKATRGGALYAGITGGLAGLAAGVPSGSPLVAAASGLSSAAISGLLGSLVAGGYARKGLRSGKKLRKSFQEEEQKEE